MKLTEYLFRSLRRKIALNIRDNQNQNAEQHHNFNRVVDEKLNAAAYLARSI